MQTKYVWALAIACVAVLTFCMTFLMEQYDTDEWLGESSKAKRNPFLAAEYFLDNRGVTVVKTNDIIDFETIPVDQTILLTEVDSMLVSPRQVQAALKWIKRGGYLVAGVGKETQGQTSILKHFDIEPEYLEDEGNSWPDEYGDKTASERLREMNAQIEEKQKANDAEDGSDTNGSESKDKEGITDQPFSNFFTNQLEQEYYRLKATDQDDLFITVLDRIILNHYLIYDDSEQQLGKGKEYVLNAWASDENGTRLLQLDFGEGSFVALSSSRMWNNNNIGMADHAYFLSYLVPDNSTLQLFFNVQSPRLDQILHQYFPELIWATFGFIALWLWQRGIRAQPIQLTSNDQRRNFAEHLRSSAEFLMREKQYTALIKPIKQDIEKQIQSHQRGFAELNEPAKIAILCDKSGLSNSVIESWLAYCEKIENQEQLFAALKLGNAIRKKL